MYIVNNVEDEEVFGMFNSEEEAEQWKNTTYKSYLIQSYRAENGTDESYTDKEIWDNELTYMLDYCYVQKVTDKNNPAQVAQDRIDQQIARLETQKKSLLEQKGVKLNEFIAK